jgi:hypothetical protein
MLSRAKHLLFVVCEQIKQIARADQDLQVEIGTSLCSGWRSSERVSSTCQFRSHSGQPTVVRYAFWGYAIWRNGRARHARTLCYN